jgi:hypothetical protein
MSAASTDLRTTFTCRLAGTERGSLMPVLSDGSRFIFLAHGRAIELIRRVPALAIVFHYFILALDISSAAQTGPA